MPITVEATYEDGVLKPKEPLPLKEHENVQLTVCRSPSLAEQTYGLIGFTGDADTFDRLLNESEAEFWE